MASVVKRVLSSRWWVVLGVSGLVACKFDPPSDVEHDADLTTVDGAPDAVPDAPTACAPSTTDCDETSGRYVECSPEGFALVDVLCPLGCAPDVEACLDVDPSNELAGYLDQARDDDTVTSIDFTGASTIDTDTGAVTIGSVPVDVTSAVANGIRVLMFKDVEISGTVKVSGTLPLAILSDGDIEITGALDVSADGVVPGPGASQETACIGGSTANTASNPVSGAGGGGHFHAGARGGLHAGGTSAGAGGTAASDPDLTPLVGGCPGGAATFLIFPAPPPNGGGGGGAVQLTARGRIALTGSGVIDASGGGASGPGPGAGGGAGGSVLLEAPTIVLDGPGVVVSTKGGGGGGARSSSSAYAPGEDGGTGAQPAAGGSLSNHAAGGSGGTEAAQPTVGQNGNSTNQHGGGGGGSVGEALFKSRSGAVTPASGAAVRSRFATETISSRVSQ